MTYIEYVIRMDREDPGQWWTVLSRDLHGQYSLKKGEIEESIIGKALNQSAAVLILTDWLNG